MHRKTSPLKRKSPSLSQGKITTPPALRNISPATSSSSPKPNISSGSSTQQHQQQKRHQSDPTTPSLSPVGMGSTGAPDSVDPLGNVTVLRTVIPTPAAAGIIFDSRDATRWVEEVLAFFKDWNCIRKDRHERILRHIDITLREDVRAMPEYSSVPFDEDAFLAALKRKYRDYDDDYTKHTRPFLDALVLSVQHEQIGTKDFIELFHRVSGNLKSKKLLDEVERANLFLYALPNRIRSKIVKKHNVDQDDGSTLVYSEFYKTALGVCESDEVINRYKESRNPAALSSKANAINNIIKSLSISKKVNPIVPETYPISPSGSQPPRASVLVPTIDRMFPTKLDPTSKGKRTDPRDDLARQLEELRIAQAEAIRGVRDEISQELRAALSQNRTGYDNRGYRQGGRGFRGDRFYAPQSSQDPSAGNTVHASAVYRDFGEGRRYSGNTGFNCFACYNIDKDGNPEQYPHGHSDRCPQLQELIQTGVCHKNSNGRLCLGPWREGAEEVMLRRDTPWVRQIVSRTRGT